MKEQLSRLKRLHASAKTEEDMKYVDDQMKMLSNQDPDAFAEAMVELAKETAGEAVQFRIREQLKEILPIVSMSYIAKRYFGKTRQWLYQRVNGSLVNGKPATFTPEEKEKLTKALNEIGRQLVSIHIS